MAPQTKDADAADKPPPRARNRLVSAGFGGTWITEYVERGDSTIRWRDPATGADSMVCSPNCTESVEAFGLADNGAPGLSPDGTKIVFADTRGDDENAVVTIANRDGSGAHQLCGRPGQGVECVDTWPTAHGGAHGPKFSHDGQRVIYGGDAIYSIDLDGVHRNRLVGPFLNSRLLDPVESADGQHLYFTAVDSAGRSTIWRANANGRNPAPLGMPDPYSPSTARPSPDGSKIVFVNSWGWGPGYGQIWIATATAPMPRSSTAWMAPIRRGPRTGARSSSSARAKRSTPDRRRPIPGRVDHRSSSGWMSRRAPRPCSSRAARTPAAPR
jgi:dipeptidyl aminopeptidase/acylaminoacyl peptidase